MPTHTGARREGMVLVAGGSARLGSRRFYAEELGSREVVLPDLWFDEHPVTNTEFARFVEDTGHVTVAEVAPDATDFPGADPALLVPGSQLFAETPGPVDLRDWTQWWRWQPGASWRAPQGPASTWTAVPDHPVTHVGWEDATAYADWAGKRLATEDEWEHAARGGLEGEDYAWGSTLHPDGRILANTWIGQFPWRSADPDGYHRTSPVGSYPRNDFGLADMIGNVWEWTSTPWGDRGQAAADEEVHACCGGSAHQQVHESDRFVMKGGSHLCSPQYCQRYRPGSRQAHGVRDTTSHLGFRCVMAA